MKMIELDNETIDDLIAQHPGFIASIRRARQQKAEGRVYSLAEVRGKYSTDNEAE